MFYRKKLTSNQVRVTVVRFGILFTAYNYQKGQPPLFLIRLRITCYNTNALANHICMFKCGS